jgi:hypothetical protein
MKFAAPLKALIEEGVIEYRKGGKVRLTQHVVESLPLGDPPRGNAATHMRLRLMVEKGSPTFKTNQLLARSMTTRSTK